MAPIVGSLAVASPAAPATAGESISGAVTNASSTAVSGICVQAFPSGSTTSSGATTTASDGTYTISGLAAGSYDVEFTNGCGNTATYLTQWYDDATSQSNATAVTVTATKGATGVGATLVVGGAVTGTVTDTSSSALAGICVDAYATTAPNTAVASTTTASDGTYSLSPLPAANYYVEFSDGCGDTGGYLTQWYSGAHTETSGTAVAVTAGSTTSGINAAMVEGATISGTVTSGSSGVSGICVDAFVSVGQNYVSGFATTGTGGTYSIVGLATGSYYVEFDDGCGQTGTYASQWYPDAPTEGDATAVVATAGLTSSGIDAALVATQAGTGSISGTVTDAASKTALAGICVYADPRSGAGAGFGNTVTASNGTYTISGLAVGTYDVEFADGCGSAAGYADQWYKDASTESSATLVTVTANKTTSGVKAAMVQGGTISGTVTNASSTALEGVCVEASLAGGSTTGSSTASDGTYSIQGLTPGSYTVEFDPCESGSTYAPQWYDDATSESAATPVVVSAGGTTADIDASLVQGGVISGKVTGVAGGGLKGICVDAYPVSYGGSGYATTAANGTYTISGLAAGSYDVDFSTTNCSTAGNYIGQWYNDAPSESQATLVSVTVGQTSSGIDATLVRGATITGTVTDAGNHDLSGICVTADPTSGFEYQTYETTTDAYGTYTLTRLPAGSYDIEFTTGKSCGNTGNYAAQWYQDATSQSSATPVTVTAGTTTSSIDATMAAGGAVSGKVTASGSPLGGICVDLEGGPTQASTTTAADGTYSLGGLSSGTYEVEFSAGSYCGNSGSYLTQWYKGASSESGATPIAVTTGHTTSGIDAAMVLGGSISGTVKDTSGAKLSGICVYADGGPSSASAETAADGTYSLTGLAPGSYDVEFTPGCGSNGYQTQWYKKAATASEATPVKVTAGANSTSVNASLSAGGSISGTVKSKSGTSLAGICVGVLNGPTYESAQAVTGSNGKYTIPGLAPGSYDVTFTTGSACGNTGNYLTDYYKNATSSQDATPVEVTSGNTTSGINASLPVAGSISGTVVDASDTALSDICVEAGGKSATTAANGSYTITGLTSGSYQVEFAPAECGSDAGYATQWYKDSSAPSGATLVAVANGKTASGIDATLLGTGSISGTVTGPSSTLLTGICVSATALSTGAGASVDTGSGGTYTLSGLSPGAYAIEFSASSYCGNGGNYLSQWYHGASSESTATPVTVTAGTVTPNINATLKQGGQIKGIVKDASSSPLAGICVDAEYGPGSGYATTASDGTYILSGLPTGSYDVEFYTCGGSASYPSQWYKGATSLGSASPVSVTDAKTTSGIDATFPATGSISGTVTDSSAAGLSGICVGLFQSGGTEIDEVITSSSGGYSFSGIEAGKYRVAFNVLDAPYYCDSASNYLGKWYKNAQTQATATVVTLAGGATVTGIDVTLSPAGSLTGKVTNAATGRGLVGVCVEASSGVGGVEQESETSATGSYTISRLPSGSYQVSFDGNCGNGGNFAPQWYKAASTAASATPVAVRAGTTKTGVNAALTAGGVITGTVTNSAGHPLARGCVFVIGAAGNASSSTAADGTYSVSGLATGTYDVEFFSSSYCFGQSLWYGGASTQPGATPVTVTAGTTTSGINGSFPSASVGSGAISGKVTNGSAAPVAGICVYITGVSSYGLYGYTETATNGTYSVAGLEAGMYTVEFYSGCGSTKAYAAKYYKDAPTQSSATPVVVTAGATTPSVNARMALAGTIEGSVTAGTKPVAGVCVDAYIHGTSQIVGSGYTEANGSYSISDLPAGSYDVEFAAERFCSSVVGDATQWYDNATSQAAGTPVAVTAGKVTTGITASLAKGGDITGSVGMGGQPVEDGCVSAYQAGSSLVVATASTTLAGTYQLTGLPTGSYDVQFGCGPGNDAVQWYNGAGNESTATAVAVTAGATTSGISATLVAAGSVSGTVVSTTSAPMGGVCVSAYDPGSSLVVSSARTNPDGTYTLSGLATSSYDIEFDPTCDGSPSDPGVQWYQGKTSQATANAVSVTAGSTKSGIGATLS